MAVMTPEERQALRRRLSPEERAKVDKLVEDFAKELVRKDLAALAEKKLFHQVATGKA